MADELRDRLTSRDLWMRALFMIFFAIVYSVAEILLILVVLFQFLTILFTGSANAPSLRLGGNLASFIYQIVQFQTFNTEERPFPFSDWPDQETSDNRWLVPAEAPPPVDEVADESEDASFKDENAEEGDPPEDPDRP